MEGRPNGAEPHRLQTQFGKYCFYSNGYKYMEELAIISISS